jgi:hypothetical protein
MEKFRYFLGSGIVLLFLTCLVPMASGATLAWDEVAGAEEYIVYWGTSVGSYSNSRSAGINNSYSLDSISLDEGVVYYFTVTAKNAAGESGYADPPIVYEPGDATPPTPPTGVTAIQID